MIGAFYIFTEFIRHQLRFNADLRPVGLDHFRHQTGIGILAWLRMVPEVNRESLWITRLLKQGLRFLQIMRRVPETFVIWPLRWRNRSGGRVSADIKDGVKKRLF